MNDVADSEGAAAADELLDVPAAAELLDVAAGAAALLLLLELLELPQAASTSAAAHHEHSGDCLAFPQVHKTSSSSWPVADARKPGDSHPGAPFAR